MQDPTAKKSRKLMFSASPESPQHRELYNGFRKKQRHTSQSFDDVAVSKTPDKSCFRKKVRVSLTKRPSKSETALRLGFSNDPIITMIDWDDTVLPRSAVEQKNSGPLIGNQLQVHQHQVMQLFLQLLALGPVYLVSNSAPNWPEESCKRWLPYLWPIIKLQVQVVSARLYEQHYSKDQVNSTIIWKYNAFRRILQQSPHADPHCIVIGDSFDEALAGVALHREIQHQRKLRSFRVIKLRQPQQCLPQTFSVPFLTNQIAVIRRYLSQMIDNDRAFGCFVVGTKKMKKATLQHLIAAQPPQAG